MKYVSIDIETTGLDSENDDVLEVGAIIEDTTLKLPREQCPILHCYVDKERYSGNSFALAMNAHIFKKINELRKGDKEGLLIKYDAVLLHLSEWMLVNGLIGRRTVAGKNFMGFDYQFLKRMPGSSWLNFHYRVLDPAILFINFKLDTELPNLTQCKQRAEFIDPTVTHNAVDDAWDVIELLRTRY